MHRDRVHPEKHTNRENDMNDMRYVLQMDTDQAIAWIRDTKTGLDVMRRSQDLVALRAEVKRLNEQDGAS